MKIIFRIPKTAWADPTVVVGKAKLPLPGMRTATTPLTPGVEGGTTAAIGGIKMNTLVKFIFPFQSIFWLWWM